MNEFLQRLKQRKLVQWAVAYVAASFALLQGVDIVAQRFGWPDLLERSLIIATCVGFFVALVLAWYHGEHGAQRMTGTELLILALLLAIGGGFLWRFAGISREQAVRPATASSPVPLSISEKSIAVLPFENLSADKDNGYFATGMQDEILTRLAGIRDLKVISRTSTEQYASRPPNLKIVAEQLGVATVLEGSVQKAGAAVHINVQLLDAHSDSHLWAQSYDRDLKDIFGVQRDVAEKVADALEAQMLPAESARIATVPTRNPEAYDRFLKAENFTRQFETGTVKDPVESVRTAADLYASAIAADPDFALAYARLSYLKASAYWRGTDPSPQAINAAQDAATRALALQPNLPEAHLAMGYVHYWGHRDYAAALAEFATAHASLPNDTNVIAAIAFVHRRQGKLVQAIEEFEQAAVLDPRDTKQPRDLADTLGYVRRYAEAEAASDRALALAPNNVESLVNRASVMRMRGDLEGSKTALAAIPADYDPQGSVSLARFDLAMAMRQPDAALAAIDKAPAWLQDIENNILVPVMLLRGRALAQKGEAGPARAAFLQAQQMLQGPLREPRLQAAAESNLAIVYAGLGQKEAALQAGGRATALLPLSQDMLDGSFYLARLARIEAQVGETESAIKHIEQLLAAPAGYEVSAASLRFDPTWDPLRNDPRFQKVIAAAEAALARDQVKP
jgi:TolB-like protein/Flp pilus assembly protein TadD